MAIDVGTYKVGYAVSDTDGRVIEHGIIYRKGKERREKRGEKRFFIGTKDINKAIMSIIEMHGIKKLVVGNGTSNEMVSVSGVEVEQVNEYNSTQEAKALFWKERRKIKALQLIWKLFNVIPEDYDDYAAMIILERYKERMR